MQDGGREGWRCTTTKVPRLNSTWLSQSSRQNTCSGNERPIRPPLPTVSASRSLAKVSTSHHAAAMAGVLCSLHNAVHGRIHDCNTLLELLLRVHRPVYFRPALTPPRTADLEAVDASELLSSRPAFATTMCVSGPENIHMYSEW